MFLNYSIMQKLDIIDLCLKVARFTPELLRINGFSSTRKLRLDHLTQYLKLEICQILPPLITVHKKNVPWKSTSLQKRSIFFTSFLEDFKIIYLYLLKFYLLFTGCRIWGLSCSFSCYVSLLSDCFCFWRWKSHIEASHPSCSPEE